jgi:hypothetical protein
MIPAGVQQLQEQIAAALSICDGLDRHIHTNHH